MNGHFLSHMDYMNGMKQEREERINKYEVHLLNNNLQALLRALLYKEKIDKKKYFKVEHVLNNEYRVVQSSLFDIRYINNLENPMVVTAQALLIYHILKEEDIEQDPYYQDKLQGLMYRLQLLDHTSYQLYVQNRDAY